jgi:DNA-binding protein H-NS
MAIDLKTLNHSQLADLIARAHLRQEELAKEKVSKLRERINALIQSEGLTTDEFFGQGSPRGGGRSKNKGVKVKPKYRNLLDPAQTWTGRGKRPRWFVAALAEGKTDQDMLIAG